MSDASPDREIPILSELLQEDAAFEDLVGEFVGRLSDRVKELEEAIRGADFESLRVAAHQLKGSGGGYGYPIITDRAGQLEQLAIRGAVQDCVKAITELRSIAGRVEAGFAGHDSGSADPSSD
jgi:HPt (histidine-containing phosphotransfer) domain-containing protein